MHSVDCGLIARGIYTYWTLLICHSLFPNLISLFACYRRQKASGSFCLHWWCHCQLFSTLEHCWPSSHSYMLSSACLCLAMWGSRVHWMIWSTLRHLDGACSSFSGLFIPSEISYNFLVIKPTAQKHVITIDPFLCRSTLQPIFVN